MIINNVNVNELKFNNLDVDTLKWNGEVVWSKAGEYFNWKLAESEMINKYGDIRNFNSIFIKKGQWLSDPEYSLTMTINVSYGDTIAYRKYNQVGNTVWRGEMVTYTGQGMEGSHTIVFDNDCNCIVFDDLHNENEVLVWNFTGHELIQRNKDFEAWICGNAHDWSTGIKSGESYLNNFILQNGSWITSTRYLLYGDLHNIYFYNNIARLNTNIRYLNLTFSDLYSLDYNQCKDYIKEILYKDYFYQYYTTYTYIGRIHTAYLEREAYILVKDYKAWSNFQQYIKEKNLNTVFSPYFRPYLKIMIADQIL